jgi:hypothetical protein
VAQDIDEPWPVEVIGHDGKAYNVSMIPGDMVLYESHSVLHGRPYPLVGRYYANIFVHFIPVDHDEENAKDQEDKKNRDLSGQGFRAVPYSKFKDEVPSLVDKVKAFFSGESESNKRNNIGGHEQTNHNEVRG